MENVKKAVKPPKYIMREHLDSDGKLYFYIEKHHYGEVKFLVELPWPFKDKWDWYKKHLLSVHPVAKFKSEEIARSALKRKLEREGSAYVKHTTIDIENL